MPATWPGSLPTNPTYGWTELPGDGRVRTQTDAGPAKLRRRFSSSPAQFSVQFIMTTDQATRLVQFFENASDAAIAGTNGGVMSFDGLPHPRTSATATFRFLSPPTLTQMSNTVYRVSLSLELVG